jgi:hypothetical protein
MRVSAFPIPVWKSGKELFATLPWEHFKSGITGHGKTNMTLRKRKLKMSSEGL